MHLRISICIKFHFEQTILNFWTKFFQERYLLSKTEKLKIIIEFRLFKLVLDNFDFFLPDLPKKDFSDLKLRKWTPHVFYIILHIQISLVRNFSSNCKFWFYGPNLPKKVFLVKTWKSEHHHWIPYIQVNLGTKFLLKFPVMVKSFEKHHHLFNLHILVTILFFLIEIQACWI